MKLKNVIAGLTCMAIGAVIGMATTITTLSSGLTELKATYVVENTSILDKIKKWFS